MNIGFVVNNVGNSDMSYDLIKTINRLGDDSNAYSPCIFFSTYVPPVMNPMCLSMNISGLSSFTGIAVATSLETADILYRNSSNTKNYLYLWDLQWLYNAVNYEMCVTILDSFEKIFVRSESHQKIVNNYINKNNISIAKNMDELLKCLT
jgi:hypothetical protein